MKKIKEILKKGIETFRKPRPEKELSPAQRKALKICNLLSLPLHAVGCCLLYFVIEALSRRAAAQAWTFMTEKPLVFLYNAFLIFTTFLVVYLFRRRTLARLVMTFFWLLLGIINCVILSNRVTPFTGPDLKNLSDGAKVVTKYLSGGTVILAFAALAAVILFLVWFWFKGPKFRGKIRWYVNIPAIIAACFLFAGVTELALQNRVLSSYFVNIAFAYEDYGYPYCLAVTLFETGIGEPNGYSEELVDEIERSQGEQKENDSVMPNIIFLQLESFFDPSTVTYLNLSEDPIPFFHQLMDEYSSGWYRVPVVGAGTANTEFETITGMSLRYFGPGEYPYKSVLQEETCESAPYVLKDLGYSTHAIHNNEANFYSRRTVFSRLGFDSFTSEEYMPDISDTTPTGWVKDHILTDEIIKALDSSPDQPDYVYAISVQGRGDYQNEPVLDDPKITVSGAEDKVKNNYAWEYYVNEINEMDQFIQELVERLEAYDEPTVLVMYGDHLPTMDLQMDDLSNKYLYQTQYVIWDNMGLEKKNKNLSSYQIAAEVLDRVGIHNGTIFRYHQTRKNTKNYQVDLEVLQYDLLYGKRYAYGMDGETPYERTQMELGVVPITLTGAENMGGDTWYFYGENFTASSRVEVNGEMLDTIFLDDNTLMVSGLELKDGDQVTIAQQSNSSTKKVLSRTDPWICETTVTLTPSVAPEAEGSETPSMAGSPENAQTETPAAEDGTQPEGGAAPEPDSGTAPEVKEGEAPETEEGTEP